MERKLVTLKEVTCCAMNHSFLLHPSQVREWGRAIGPLQVFREIFQNTEGLAFMPNEQTVLVYRAFAASELRRLACETDARLVCHHDAAEHIEALKEFLNLLPGNMAS